MITLSKRGVLMNRSAPALLLAIACIAIASCGGEPETRGVILGETLPADVVKDKSARQTVVTGDGDSQILFGDLHVHTTFSPDAFIIAMPLRGGSGLHPPADACDFARYCSSLDFWSINDHAEGITPRRWAETRESIRECNAASGDPANPDMVSFLGWEWSQVNTDPSRHYGHKNVIFMDTADANVPARAIAAPRKRLAQAPIGRALQLMMSLVDFENRQFYLGIQGYYDEIADTPVCEKGVHTRELPTQCLEIAEDPRELFTKLGQWGYDSIVIPHGNSWGMNTPASTTFDKQLNSEQHDADRQILFEIYSGHGNAEEYRKWRASVKGGDGGLFCPQPSDDYLPCCHRAGEIIRERCEQAGEGAAVCQSREFEARQNFVDAGNSGHATVPGQQVVDWLNCGTCPDCFNEPMDHRPGATAQYALAITGFEEGGKSLNFRFGFIGASDNHRGQSGTGYKEVKRKFMTETFGPTSVSAIGNLIRERQDPLPYSEPLSADGVSLMNARNMERQNSFWLTGGLVATHSSGRDRVSIWNGLKRKEVYATSGDRILLWFDMINGEQRVPMGSEVSSAINPSFKVSAVGAFKQKPGCPQHAIDGLGAQRVQSLCGGECYNPGDERYRLDRIEIVRIRSQLTADEDVGELIEDPWRSFSCDGDPSGCSVEFSDDEFTGTGREAIYYARAIQETTAMINADNVRCEYDENGLCIKVEPCYGDYRTDSDDDCLAPEQQRAWSSPIFVTPQE
jgi:hypothetical protein